MRSHLLSFCCASDLTTILGNVKSKEKGRITQSKPRWLIQGLNLACHNFDIPTDSVTQIDVSQQIEKPSKFSLVRIFFLSTFIEPLLST
jgi:hypothetical protein